jgi:hypothetical protein
LIKHALYFDQNIHSDMSFCKGFTRRASCYIGTVVIWIKEMQYTCNIKLVLHGIHLWLLDTIISIEKLYLEKKSKSVDNIAVNSKHFFYQNNA